MTHASSFGRPVSQKSERENFNRIPTEFLPKVARCIPVLPSRYIGKCAARVLKRSGIADVTFSYPVHTKRQAEVTFLFAIICLYLYAYLFIITSLITGPLSVCATVISTPVHHPISIFSFLTSYEVTIASDSIIANFVSLTLYAQATVFFSCTFRLIYCKSCSKSCFLRGGTHPTQTKIQSFTSTCSPLLYIINWNFAIRYWQIRQGAASSVWKCRP